MTLLCVLLILAVAALAGKVYLLRRAMDQIGEEMGEILSTDTNVLLSLSTRDRHARRLAADLNRELRALRTLRRRYESGDRELKNAVTNISHDLRTPLTAICGYLDLLEQEKLPEEAAQYVEVIRNRAGMLTQLTEELFRYSVLLSGDAGGGREPVDLNRVLEESVAAFYTALRDRGITPAIEMPEERVVRKLDPAALSRVFSNLLGNAVKYSGDDLEITLTRAGEITFSNSAQGLSEVQVGRLFDRFYTVEAARNATGLGLSIARTLVERMGGTIDAAYTGGRLTIRVCFPEEA